MDDIQTVKRQIKAMIVANLMLPSPAEAIGDDQLLFGPDSLGLDSVDALQLVVALDRDFGLKIPDPDAASQVLRSVNTIVAAVRQNGHGPPAPEAAT